MECRKCGKILSEQERFCTYCGYYSDPNEEDDETEGFSAETIENDRHAVTVTHTEKKENIEGVDHSLSPLAMV
jgi:RNA polymerase subunit RPABC4/transcription elongation factor Spt4